MPEILKHGNQTHLCLDCGCEWRYQHDKGEVTPTTQPKCPECQSANTCKKGQPYRFPDMPLPHYPPGTTPLPWRPRIRYGNLNEVTCE